MMWSSVIRDKFLKFVEFIINPDKNLQKGNMTNSSINSGILASRKYILTLLIFVAALLLCAVPPVLSVFVFGKDVPLIILSGGEWITVMSLICGFYFSANVAQKHILKEKPVEATQENDVVSAPAPIPAIPPPPQVPNIEINKETPSA